MFTRINKVVATPLTRSLTTLQTVRDDIEVKAKVSDLYLSRLILRASDACNSYCRRDFALQSYQDTFRLGWTDQTWVIGRIDLSPLTLSVFPVLLITSVTMDGVLLVEDTDFEVDYSTGQLWSLDGYGNRNTWIFTTGVVLYQGGYALPLDHAPGTVSTYPARTLPYDVEQAALELVRTRWHARLRDPNLRGETNANGTNTTFQVQRPGLEAELPPDVVTLLQPYITVVTP